MKRAGEAAGYNERLFFGNRIRAFVHLARFRWFQRQMKLRGIKPRCVLELGCFDGKLIRFLPQPPRRYVGFDANWEGGLDRARTEFAELPQYEFRNASSPADIQLSVDELFDVAVSMETLEHLPPEDLSAYLEKLARHTEGWMFVTVPNEKGVVFLTKWIIKRLFLRDGEEYTAREVLCATLGRTNKIARNGHKGFDYDALIYQMRSHFDVLRVEGIPFSWMPVCLSFSVGIVAVPRRSVRSVQ